MKVKLLNAGDGYKQLVVADDKINALYNTTNDRPVVLASMINFFNTGCWSLSDLRLSEHRSPSPYLEGGHSHFEPKNTQERSQVLELLHTYREVDKGMISWSTFDIAHFEGDNPSCMSKTGDLMDMTARFTYQGAREKMMEIREFWNDWTQPDLTLARIQNFNRQPSDSQIMGMFSLQKMGIDTTDYIEKSLKPKRPAMR